MGEFKREWFEPGEDGVSPFERISATVGFGAAGTAAAFRALLADDAAKPEQPKHDEIVALRSEVERLTAELCACKDERMAAEIERDALQARIDAGVQAWDEWKQQCGLLWLWAFPGCSASPQWAEVCDALDAEPIEQDERKGSEKRFTNPERGIEFWMDDKGLLFDDRRVTPGTRADRGKV